MSKEYPPGIRILERQNRSRRRLLGFYEIIGGVLGLGLMSLGASSWLFDYGFTITMLCIVVTLLYIFSIVCGVLLMRNKEIGLSLSLILQIIQVAGFYFSWYGFVFVSGWNVSVGMDFSNGLDLSVYSSISNFGLKFEGNGIASQVGGDSSPFQFYFNLIAVFFIYSILLIRRNIQKEVLMKSAHDIAEPPIA